MRGATILKLLKPSAPVTIPWICDETGMDAEAVRNAIDRLSEIGVPVSILDSNEVHIARTVNPVNVSKVYESVKEFNSQMADRIDYFEQLDSTNEYLLKLSGTQDLHQRVCLSEHMTHGRGRRRKKWYGGAYENIMLSIAWNFGGDIRRIFGLSLAVAVVVIRTLGPLTGQRLEVKWPNDILWNKRKLSGILVETQDHTAVVGIGINCRSPQIKPEEIDQPFVCLDEMCTAVINRDKLIGKLLFELDRGLGQFFTEGLTRFKGTWESHHAYAGEWMKTDETDSTQGRAIGIDSEGALVLKQSDGTVRCIRSGEVSLSREDSKKL